MSRVFLVESSIVELVVQKGPTRRGRRCRHAWLIGGRRESMARGRLMEAARCQFRGAGKMPVLEAGICRGRGPGGCQGCRAGRCRGCGAVRHFYGLSDHFVVFQAHPKIWPNKHHLTINSCHNSNEINSLVLLASVSITIFLIFSTNCGAMQHCS